MKTYQIHILRHGITDGNLSGQYIGSTDLPLCEKGVALLDRLAESYAYPHGQVYITSPMLRCRQTLELLYPGAEGIAIDELRECDFGDFEGKTKDELQKDKDYAEWMTGGSEASPPNGESGARFAERVCGTFEKIIDGLMKTGTTSTVIVTHSGIISMLLSRYGLPKAAPMEWTCEPGRGYSIRIHPQLWMSGRVFEVYDRIPHIKKQKDDD